MKLKDMLNRVKNNANGQSVWNPKKKKLKEIGLTEDELLEMNVGNNLKRYIE